MNFQRGRGFRPFGRGLLAAPFAATLGGPRRAGAGFGLAPLVRPAHGIFRGCRGGGPRGPRPTLNKGLLNFSVLISGSYN